MVSKERRRQDLLTAARSVFADKGFHETKVGDIARQAKVAKGTVYLYFPDKRSIFVELIDQLFVRLSAAIVRVDTDGDVEAQVKHNVRAVVGVLIDDPETMRMLFSHASAVDPSFTQKIDSFYGGLLTLLSESLAEGQQLGIVRQGDTRLLSLFTLGALKETLLAASREPQWTRELVVEELYQVLCQGYLRV